jgi:SAM-dependent methyltransferase
VTVRQNPRVSPHPDPATDALRSTFDEVAEVYDRARPAYPDALVRDLAALVSDRPRPHRVLEVGPGTGQLTVPLARYGFHVTAVELGRSLAAVARRRLAEFPDARVEVAAFEEWPLPAEPFDAVVFATSFHWVDPAVRLAKAARALRPGGVFAWVTTHHVAGGSLAFFDEAQRCYERWDPATPPGLRLSDESTVSTDTAPLERFHAFGAVRVRRYAREITYTTQEYLDVLSTYSGHRALAPARYRGLLTCLATLAENHHGGTITKRYLHELITAERA